MNEAGHLEQDLLNEYLDHALEPGQQELIERHLLECDLCRARLDELRQLFVAIEAIPESRLEWDLSAEVMTEIRRQPPKQISAWSNLAFILQAFVATIILAAAWPVISGGFPVIPFILSSGPSIAPLIELTQFWSSESQQILQAIQQAGFQDLDWIRQVFFTNQSALLAWTTCLGVTFVLWLVGNSLLLRSKKTNHNRRTS